MVVPFSRPPGSIDTSQHGILKMHRLGPPICCYSCVHVDCERRRREARVECVVCNERVQPEQFYRILSRINNEVSSVVHMDCERRAWPR